MENANLWHIKNPSMIRHAKSNWETFTKKKKKQKIVCRHRDMEWWSPSCAGHMCSKLVYSLIVIHSNGKLNFYVWVKASITIMWSMANSFDGVCSIIFSDKRFTNLTMKNERFRCVCMRSRGVWFTAFTCHTHTPEEIHYFRFYFAGSIGRHAGRH